MKPCSWRPKLRSGLWWALVNSPGDLPVLFETRQQALNNAEPDEFPICVRVYATSPRQRFHVVNRGARRIASRLWHRFRHAKGLCVKCGLPNPRHPKWYCLGCAKKESARPRRRAA